MASSLLHHLPPRNCNYIWLKFWQLEDQFPIILMKFIYLVWYDCITTGSNISNVTSIMLGTPVFFRERHLKSVKSWWKFWRGLNPSSVKWFSDSPNDRWIVISEQIQISGSESADINNTVRNYPYLVNRTPTDDHICGEGMGKVRVDK